MCVVEFKKSYGELVMTFAVRYFSRSGNTKKIAEAIAEELGTVAVSVDSSDAALNEKVDVLFVGGALYAYGIDKKLKAYLKDLDASKVGKVAAFSTTMISAHANDVIKKLATAKGVNVQPETFFCKSKAVDSSVGKAKEFAKASVK